MYKANKNSSNLQEPAFLLFCQNKRFDLYLFEYNINAWIKKVKTKSIKYFPSGTSTYYIQHYYFAYEWAIS